MAQASRISIQISAGTIGSNKTLQQIERKNGSTKKKRSYKFLRIKNNTALFVDARRIDVVCRWILLWFREI